MKSTLRHWKAVAGLDFHVLTTLLLRGWSIVAGGFTLLLLPLSLTPAQQGYYFTFASVLGLQVFFELGLNQVVMQRVSHEVAHLIPTTQGDFQGDAAPLGRLASLVQLLDRWYQWAALLFALLAAVVGCLFFMSLGSESLASWLGPWLIIVAATALNLRLSPGLAVLEGCGRVGDVARLRLEQSLLGCLVFWALLRMGAGLWAAIAVPLANFLCTAYWLRSRGGVLHWLAEQPVAPQHRLLWRRDVMPLQWRMALSWASGYLIFNLFTPVVFARQGAEEAGRLGLALTLFSAISTVGMSWVYAKAPDFTRHIARGERRALNELFKNVLIRSTVVVSLACLLLVGVAWGLRQAGVALMLRLASPNVLWVLAVITVLNAVVAAMATYMRSHREEPMMVHSVVMGLVVANIVYWGAAADVLTMLLLYLLAIVGSLPWTIYLFLGYFKKEVGCPTRY